MTEVFKFSAETLFFFCRLMYNVTMKIWAKIIKEHKTIKQYVYEKEERLTYSHFFSYMADICSELDVPTPVLLKAHIMDFAKFRHVKFKAKDFIEITDFDVLWIENIE